MLRLSQFHGVIRMTEEKYTVLIVEDEPLEQEFIKTMISQNLCGGGGAIFLPAGMDTMLLNWQKNIGPIWY